MLDTLLGRQDIEREERNASKSSIKDSARVCVCGTCTYSAALRFTLLAVRNSATFTSFLFW